MDKQNTDHKEGGIDELDEVIQTGGCLSQADIDNLLQKLFSKGCLFLLDDEGFARSLVETFSNRDAWKFDLVQLREEIEKLYGCPNDIPTDLKKVPEWVRKELFVLDHLPREKLAERYDWASKDLLAIKANMADCERAIEEVEQRKPKTDKDPSDLRFYKYYLKLNQTAKDEIIEILTDDIRRKALNASYGFMSIMSAFVDVLPWSFRRYPNRFDFATFSPVRHTFAMLPVLKRRKVQRLYEKYKPQFYKYRERFITNYKIPEKIQDFLKVNHLLAARKGVLLQALDAYEQGKLELFVSAIATQIEGIIEDGCLLSGISLKELRQGTIKTKLEALLRETPIYIDYVYYAFKFPILRNRVAHGRTSMVDVRHEAHQLLLDLYDCCRIVSELTPAPRTR